MHGEINVNHLMREAQHQARSHLTFQERMRREAIAMALNDWLSADDKDEARERWGELLAEALTHWKQSRKRQASCVGAILAYQAGRISRATCLKIIHDSEQFT
jgi:hypothetical protein